MRNSICIDDLIMHNIKSQRLLKTESVSLLQPSLGEIWNFTLFKASSRSEYSPSLIFSIFIDSAPINPIGKSSWLAVETRWTSTNPFFMCMKLVALVSSRSNNVISKLWPRLRQCNGCLSLCSADSIYFLGPMIIIWFTPLYKMIFAWNGFLLRRVGEVIHPLAGHLYGSCWISVNLLTEYDHIWLFWCIYNPPVRLVIFRFSLLLGLF